MFHTRVCVCVCGVLLPVGAPGRAVMPTPGNTATFRAALWTSLEKMMDQICAACSQVEQQRKEISNADLFNNECRPARVETHYITSCVMCRCSTFTRFWPRKGILSLMCVSLTSSLRCVDNKKKTCVSRLSSYYNFTHCICSLSVLKDGQSDILYMFWDSVTQMLSVELQKTTEGQWHVGVLEMKHGLVRFAFRSP